MRYRHDDGMRGLERSVRAIAAVAALWALGCAPPGPHVRVATATAAEIQAASKEPNVWYEFQPGDIVPVQFGYLGAIEGGTDQPAVLRAKRSFYLVTTHDGGMRISFDGKSFAGEQSSQSVIAVVPRKDGKGGALAWVIYIGESGDPDAELSQVLAETEAPADPQ